MCSVAAVGAWAAVAGAAVSVYSAQEQSRYNKEVAENNAITAEYQAADAIERGNLEEKQSRLRAKNLIGKQKSAIAGSGFTLDESGSAGDVIADTAMLGEEDVLAIRSNAAREAWSFRVQGTNAQAQGQLATAEGNSKSASSLINGAGSVSSKWYKWRKVS